MLKFRSSLGRAWVALLILGSQACTTSMTKEAANLRLITEAKGADSLRLINTQSTVWGSTATAEALRCR